MQKEESNFLYVEDSRGENELKRKLGTHCMCIKFQENGFDLSV